MQANVFQTFLWQIPLPLLLAYQILAQNCTRSPIDAFFARYPPFSSYNPSAPATSEFHRMCNFFAWDEDERKGAARLFQNALTLEFNNIYGADANSLVSWQKLCSILRITPVPEEIEACRAAVQHTHVNIVDLIDTHRTAKRVKVFPSERALSDYTKKTKKFFPKENIYAGGLLRHLLRQIMNPELADRSHLDEFFARYNQFTSYNPSAPAISEFYRLCDFFGWKKDSSKRKKARERFRDALTQEFNEIYGTDAHRLPSWQALCRILDISPIPDDLEVCQATVKRTHVNIVDLVDTQRTLRRVEVFPSEVELSKYTKETRKYFPPKNAYAGGLLRYLLRHITNPGLAHTRDRSSGTPRGRKGGGSNGRGAGRDRSGTGRRSGSQV
ncbi:hypothetical protein BD410DRAFT_902445 [Rickenella mellea]|uniref:Uncharacterized protein n=1 Tax=Rickenella mellea TaxID=50990 RepID=A0A4Y7PJU5_9AGAM|nr:hypothetical protein BD410DRAFT_902445 [Rickenella mellea]